MERPADQASPLADSLSQAKTLARDQLTAAWQLQIELLEEHLSTLLASGWRERIERVFEERFAELATEVDQRFHNEVESRSVHAAEVAKAEARREFAETLSRFARRLRNASAHQEWLDAVLDAALSFGQRAALFGVFDGRLKLESARGLNSAVFNDRTVPLAEAPAFASAVETLDPVIAMRTPGELSEPVAALSSSEDARPVHLFPLVAHGRTLAVLYVESTGATPEVGALELIASVAAAALEVRSVAQQPAALVAIAGAGDAGPATASRDWASLSKTDQELHLKAQRFARVQVAAMRLYKANSVKSGRESGDLYNVLRPDIDAGREEFRTQFQNATPTMVDYLHLELVRSLANDDPALLGPHYPGPLQ